MSLLNRLFGFEFVRQKDSNENIRSPELPDSEESSIDIQNYGGVPNAQVHTMNIDARVFGDMNENRLIEKYREVSYIPLVDKAIEEIISDMIVTDDTNDPIEINVDEVKITDKYKDDIVKAFEHTMNLLQFNIKGYDIARRWYIDGRIHYHLLIDAKRPNKGVQEVRYVDPRKLKKVRHVNGKVDYNQLLVSASDIEEYYLYSPTGIQNSMDTASGVLKISKDAISSTSSDSWTYRLAHPCPICTKQYALQTH